MGYLAGPWGRSSTISIICIAVNLALKVGLNDGTVQARISCSVIPRSTSDRAIAGNPHPIPNYKVRSGSLLLLGLLIRQFPFCPLSRLLGLLQRVPSSVMPTHDPDKSRMRRVANARSTNSRSARTLRRPCDSTPSIHSLLFIDSGSIKTKPSARLESEKFRGASSLTLTNSIGDRSSSHPPGKHSSASGSRGSSSGAPGARAYTALSAA